MRDAVIPLGLVVALLGAAAAARTDDRVLPGHSRYGEAFDRGPRQRAYLMGGTGDVHFPVSSRDPLVQKFIEQGIGQLHGFWFVEAERSFRQAARLDPHCGIAYWGMALANRELSPLRSRQFAAEAAKHKTGLSERETMYIDALRDENGYRAIMARYPTDLEAAAFEVWRLWHKREAGDPSASTVNSADQLITGILRVEPMHPIRHAAIHFADSTNSVSRAVDSAARCGESAPAIGHMWHMPVHVYFPLKRYPEAAWQLEASIRTENARVMHDRSLPSHLYAHNNEWLARTLMYLGRVQEARRVAMSMIDLPRSPSPNTIDAPNGESRGTDPSQQQHPRESFGTSADYGRAALLQILRQYEYWDDLIELCRTGYIEPTQSPLEQGEIHANLGMAYFCNGSIEAGENELANLRQAIDGQTAARTTSQQEARKLPEERRPAALAAVNSRFTASISRLDQLAGDLEDYRRIARGTYLNRRMFVVAIGCLVGAEAIVFWFLRRRIVAALLTVLAAILAGGWAVQCHLALLNLPYHADNVDFAFICGKLLEAGDFEEAEWSARNFAQERANQVRPQANLVEVLFKAGKKDQALLEFTRLRELAATADLESPPLARLAPIARDLDLPSDWRLPKKVDQALSGRRPLESLGPLLWRPAAAPDWTLKDGEGRPHSFAQFRGKPVILIFVLGAGCAHCRIQLEAFRKMAKDFDAAGLTIIAINCDDEAGVRRCLSNQKREPFPFLMLADPRFTSFQAYGAFDDFEQIALHGTFLIDGDGLLRWSDVGFEPFTDAAFLLAESKRLLTRPVAPVPGAKVIAADRAAVPNRR
jgi:peroxiredoxin